MDVDDDYNMKAVKAVTYDTEDRMFYILANKYFGKLGFFLLLVPEDDPKEGYFLMKFKDKLDIGDANIYVLWNKDLNIKELVCSYKTIFINTYSILNLDISGSSLENRKNGKLKDENHLIFKFETF